MGIVPMTVGRDEVKATVHTIVLNVLPVQPTLVPEVLFKLLVDVVLHCLPAEYECTEIMNYKYGL